MLQSEIITVSGETKKNSLLNEDVTMIIEEENFCFYGIADGQSRKMHCVDGASVSLTAVAACLKEEGIKKLLQKQYFDEIQYELVKTIRRNLECQADRFNTDVAEFGSTLLCLAVDPMSGSYILIHLGDGRAVGEGKDGVMRNISCPENGICLNQTWLTTSSNAANHIRIYTGNINNYRRIAIMSDGADRLFQKEIRRPYISGKPEKYDVREIASLITGKKSLDDSSCIIVNVC